MKLLHNHTHAQLQARSAVGRLFRWLPHVVAAVTLVAGAFPAAAQCLAPSPTKRSFVTTISGSMCSDEPFPTLVVGKTLTSRQTSATSFVAEAASFVASVISGTDLRPSANDATIQNIDFAGVSTPLCNGGWLTQEGSAIHKLSREEIDRIAPAGNYTLTLGYKGVQSSATYALSPYAWPKTPRLINFAEAQSINPSQDFTLRLDADVSTAKTEIIYLFPIGGADPTQFSLAVQNAIAWMQDIRGCDTPSSATWTIPAGTLVPGVRYQLGISSGKGWTGSSAVTAPGLSFGIGEIVTVEIQAKGPPIVVPPVIISQPSSQERNPGETATFAVTAVGTGPISYQWLKNGAPIPGAVSATYTLASVKAQDAGAYSVRVSGPRTSVTSEAATLVVKPGKVPPTITDQPDSITKKVGQKATFSVRATGSAVLQYQWYRNGRKLNGETSRTLTIKKVATSHAGKYYVVIKNPVGRKTSATAVLKVTK